MNHTQTIVDKALAWGVHLLTASGSVAGLMAILAISADAWRSAMAWLLVALVIDSVDGTFARWFKTSEVLPKINGKTMDNVIDYLNYAVIPAYFFYKAGLVHPAWNLPLTVLILAVSTIYYGKEGMVSDDNYFIGFPVMWNVVVFYLVFVFSLNEVGNAAIIVVFSILHFVPVKFAYPSRATRLRYLTIFAAALFVVAACLTVWFYPDVPAALRISAIAVLGYFGVLAVLDTFGIGA